MANRLGRLLRYVAEAWRYAAGDSGKTRYPTLQRPDYGRLLAAAVQGQPSTTGDSVDVDRAYRLAVTSAWVYANIRLLADRTSAEAAMPVVVDAAGTEQDNHPLLYLLRRPNPLMTGQFLRRYTCWWYWLRGNAYWFVSTPSVGQGEPVEIWPLPADMVRPIPDSLREGQGVFRGQPVLDYEYHINGRIEYLPGENVVHFRTPNPFDWWEGLSPLVAMLLSVEMDHGMKRWQSGFFDEENAIPSTFIGLPQDMDDEQFQRLVHDIKQQLEAGNRRLFGRTGDITVEVISQTLDQMQIVESRQFTRDEIDRAFNIPQGLVSGGLSGDSRHAAEVAFARNAVQPYVDYLTEQMAADIMPFYSDGLQLRPPDLVPADRALEAQEYTVYGPDRTIAENRAEQGLDLDDIPPEVQPLLQIPVRLLGMVEKGVLPVPGVTAPPANGGQANSPDAEEQPEMGPSPGGGPTPDQLAAQEAQREAALAELRRWRKVARREVRAGRDPAEREFKSAILPPAVVATVENALAGAATVEDVDRAFRAVEDAIRVVPKGADQPLPPVPARVEISEEDVIRAIRLWDELMPEYAGMLEAERVDPDEAG